MLTAKLAGRIERVEFKNKQIMSIIIRLGNKKARFIQIYSLQYGR